MRISKPYNTNVSWMNDRWGGTGRLLPYKGRSNRMDELHHECGIAAIYHLYSESPSKLAPLAGADQVSRLMPRMLLDMQNRGQLAAGFTTYNPRREQIIDTFRQVGPVIE